MCGGRRAGHGTGEGMAKKGKELNKERKKVANSLEHCTIQWGEGSSAGL